VENGSYDPCRLWASYQSLRLPATAAIEPSAAKRLKNCDRIVSPWGTDDVSDGITLKGDFQGDPVAIVCRIFAFNGRPTRREWWLVGYTAGLIVLLGTIVSSLLVAGGVDEATSYVLPVAALAVAAVVAERQSVRLSPRAWISVSALPIVLAAVIYGPLAAICVSVASLLPSFGQPYARWMIWTSTRSIAASLAGLAALALENSEMSTFGWVLATVAIATAIEQLGDVLLGSVAAMLRGMSAREIARHASTMLLAMPLYVPVTALLVYAYGRVSPWSVALFFFPAFVAQKLFHLYQEQRATAEELSVAIERQEKAHLSFASALVTTLDARDQYTAGHSAAVAIYARDIAERLGLPEAEQRMAHLCGLVHDIGKIGLHAGLLEKPGPLTLEERRLMEQHAVIGERILAKVEDYADIARIVRHHHERVDGRGYPDGLVGEGIPLLSRIIAAADAYNAMTSHRPYRDVMPTRVARLRMAQAVGTQFDTSVIAAFEALLAGAAEAYRLGSRGDFSFGAQEPEYARPLAVVS
jgi:putative nucleotidyltransferase with HDIG domain